MKFVEMSRIQMMVIGLCFPFIANAQDVKPGSPVDAECSQKLLIVSKSCGKDTAARQFACYRKNASPECAAQLYPSPSLRGDNLCLQEAWKTSCNQEIGDEQKACFEEQLGARCIAQIEAVAKKVMERERLCDAEDQKVRAELDRCYEIEDLKQQNLCLKKVDTTKAAKCH